MLPISFAIPVKFDEFILKSFFVFDIGLNGLTISITCCNSCTNIDSQVSFEPFSNSPEFLQFTLIFLLKFQAVKLVQGVSETYAQLELFGSYLYSIVVPLMASL